jgi:hypothetical protein
MEESKKCVCCKEEFDKFAVGFHLNHGFLCMGCENKDIEIVKVRHKDYGNSWIAYRYEFDADECIQEFINGSDGEEDSSFYIKEKEMMKAMEFFDLDEFGGW